MKKQSLGFPLFCALLVKWSGIAAVDGRGKVGGSVFSVSRAGAYVRNKVTPVNRRTASQQSIRSLLAGFAQAWRALTQSQRDGWNNAAANGFTYTNIFGDTKHKSGIGLYTGLNMNLDISGNATIDDAPVQGAVSNPSSIAPAAAAGATTLFVNAGYAAGDVVPAGMTLLVFATAPVSAGISFVKSQLRLIGSIPAAGDTGTTNMWADYIAKFGAPAAGSKIFVGVNTINNATGQAGIPFSESLVVAA